MLISVVPLGSWIPSRGSHLFLARCTSRSQTPFFSKKAIPMYRLSSLFVSHKGGNPQNRVTSWNSIKEEKGSFVLVAISVAGLGVSGSLKRRPRKWNEVPANFFVSDNQARDGAWSFAPLSAFTPQESFSKCCVCLFLSQHPLFSRGEWQAL